MAKSNGPTWFRAYKDLMDRLEILKTLTGKECYEIAGKALYKGMTYFVYGESPDVSTTEENLILDPLVKSINETLREYQKYKDAGSQGGKASAAKRAERVKAFDPLDDMGDF